MNKNAFFSLVFVACVYCTPIINPVSPYINRNASLVFSAYHNPYIIESMHKRPASDSQYVGFANKVYLTQKFAWGVHIVAGDQKEKHEFLGSAIMLPSPSRFKLQYKGNALEIGENTIFKNFALSPFFGAYGSFYYHDFSASDLDHELGHIYLGTAIGTRKCFEKFSYFELFASPQISSTRHGSLGDEDEYVKKINPRWPESFGLTVGAFSMPVGIGFKYRNIISKSGIVIMTTFRSKERELHGDKLIVNSYNFPVFMEFGFHFRRFRKMEKQ